MCKFNEVSFHLVSIIIFISPFTLSSMRLIKYYFVGFVCFPHGRRKHICLLDGKICGEKTLFVDFPTG